MWRSFWRSIDRFSLQHFKYIINELQQIKVVDMDNRELVIDLLQSIVEIVTYGDRQDPYIFECFMEFQVLAEFVRVLKISRNSRIEAPLLQYLSIMIQNMASEHAIYYCLSNDYINSIIAYPYEFRVGDLASYYVSFLRAVSSKVNREMLCLLVKVDGDVVVSFPLYSEALKFFHHGEKMIQTAVRALTLNIYNISDDMVYQFITTPPMSNYFSELVRNFKEQCIHLDTLVHSIEETCTHKRRAQILLETDKIVDDMYYFKDILSVGEPRLDKIVTHNLLALLVLPILLPLVEPRWRNGSTLSAVTSLYIISRLLQVVGGKNMINSTAGVLLYPYMALSKADANPEDTADAINQADPFHKLLNGLEITDFPGCESKKAEGNGEHNIFHHPHSMSSNFFIKDHGNASGCIDRSGILAYVFSDNQSVLLASLFLLLTLAESKDLECLLASAIGSSYMQCMMPPDISASPVMGGGILVRFMPQILNALLAVLASEPPSSALKQWHTGWLLRKLLICYGRTLDDHNFHLFNTSYERSCEHLRKELDGCWFDHILDTARNEWASCKTVFEEQLHSKDPLFALDIAVCQKITDGDMTSYFAWQRMVDTVKVFVLHLQLKVFILKGDLLEKPLLDLTSREKADSGGIHPSDLSCASFGSDVSLGSGIPCKIAFSSAGMRDIYLIPVAREVSGKLILAEKHPFRSRRGVVIAIAPLAGLSPKIDEDHPTWLHLRIREFDPKFNTSKSKGHTSKMANPAADGRWTLGFPTAKACVTARLLILEETSKQRRFIENILAPLLKSNYLKNLLDSQGE